MQKNLSKTFQDFELSQVYIQKYEERTLSHYENGKPIYTSEIVDKVWNLQGLVKYVEENSDKNKHIKKFWCYMNGVEFTTHLNFINNRSSGGFPHLHFQNTSLGLTQTIVVRGRNIICNSGLSQISFNTKESKGSLNFGGSKNQNANIQHLHKTFDGQILLASLEGFGSDHPKLIYFTPQGSAENSQMFHGTEKNTVRVIQSGPFGNELYHVIKNFYYENKCKKFPKYTFKVLYINSKQRQVWMEEDIENMVVLGIIENASGKDILDQSTKFYTFKNGIKSLSSIQSVYNTDDSLDKIQTGDIYLITEPGFLEDIRIQVKNPYGEKVYKMIGCVRKYQETFYKNPNIKWAKEKWAQIELPQTQISPAPLPVAVPQHEILNEFYNVDFSEEQWDLIHNDDDESEERLQLINLIDNIQYIYDDIQAQEEEQEQLI